VDIYKNKTTPDDWCCSAMNRIGNYRVFSLYTLSPEEAMHQHFKLKWYSKTGKSMEYQGVGEWYGT
jgi:hypothetical protein